MSDDPLLAALARIDAKLEKTRADIMARIDRLQAQVAQQIESGVISVACPPTLRTTLGQRATALP